MIFFNWLGEDLRKATEVEKRLAALPDVIRSFLQEEEGYMFLSPLGDAYLKAFKGIEQNRRPLKLSAQAKQHFDDTNYTTQGEYRQILERLRLGQENDWQRSAETLSGGVSKFPKGHTKHRVFLIAKEGILYVLEFSGHSNEREYQELMQNIRWSQYEHQEFIDLD